MSEPSADSPSPGVAPQPPRLLDQLRHAALAHFGRPEAWSIINGEIRQARPPRLCRMTRRDVRPAGAYFCGDTPRHALSSSTPRGGRARSRAGPPAPQPVSPQPPHAAPREPPMSPPKLLGSYATPAFEYGDVVFCERRGDIRIVGLSEAPIPWPIGQRLPRGR